MALAPILLLAAASAFADGGGKTLSPLARVEVLEGRATLARSGVLRSLRPEDGPLDDLAPAYLETSPLSRATLRWSATASLFLDGAAACEWAAGEARASLELRFFHFDEVHLEVRRGPVRVSLPGGWCAEVENAAVYLGARPDGGFVLHHDAGLPLLLAPPCESSRARPPLTVLAGARLAVARGEQKPRVLGRSGMRLLDPFGRPESSALERGPVAPPWTGFAWPWRPSCEERSSAPAGASRFSAGNAGPGASLPPSLVP